jgi:hypothetical protein
MGKVSALCILFDSFVVLRVAVLSREQTVENVVVGTKDIGGGLKEEVFEPRKVSKQVFATSTSRFVSVIASTAFLDSTTSHWRTFDEYFGLLLAIARIGYAQRRLLHWLELDMLLVDFYLGAQSPLCVAQGRFDITKRPRDIMGNKQGRPSFNNLLETAALLVCLVLFLRVCLLCLHSLSLLCFDPTSSVVRYACGCGPRDYVCVLLLLRLRR